MIESTLKSYKKRNATKTQTCLHGRQGRKDSQKTNFIDLCFVRLCAFLPLWQKRFFEEGSLIYVLQIK